MTHEAALQEIVLGTPELMSLLEALVALDLPDAWVVSGGIYQTVWNHLTGRERTYGIKDYDAIYFDSSDLSYEAEDREIQRLNAALPLLADRLELRNQARVHLWYPEKFGTPYPQLSHATQSLECYASKTHAVAVRLTPDANLEVVAPFGLENIFEMKLVPNYALDNSRTHEAKSARMKTLWPNLTVEPWEFVA